MKKFLLGVGSGALVLGLVAVSPGDASACGGCFHLQQSEMPSQVTGHRMIFSVAPEATTLWDQITYSGNPESFAWVLPTHGQVQVGLSSDAMFEALDQWTAVTVQSRDIVCPPTTCNDGTTSTVTYTSSGTTTDPNVTVIAQETVGPYETVQLSSQDPLALEAWLDSHGYAIPAEVVPIIDAYVAEGSDFLVMKLVPGQGVDSMRPVRVTSPGAGLTLPLRMVAAGTGVMTPITLWIAGEGRYEPTNFPAFEIHGEDLTWDWDTSSSDYSLVKQQKFADSDGKGWLVEASMSLWGDSLTGGVASTVANDWESSGYGMDQATAQTEFDADKAALMGNIATNAVWITRLHGELTKPALANDLIVGASANQSEVYGVIECKQEKGTPPMCPPPPNCGGSTGTTTSTNTGIGGSGGWIGAGGNDDYSASGGGCAVGGTETGSLFAAAMAALGLSVLIGKRRRNTRR